MTNKVNNEEIVKLYMSGTPVTQIAEMFSITREAVYQKLRRLEGWKGMKRLQSKKRAVERFTALQKEADQIVSKWLAGETMFDLAKEFKTNRTTISNIIKGKIGTTKRMYERDKKIAELYKNGMTQVELSKIYGISQPCISRIVNSLND